MKGVISIQSLNVVDHIICNILYELVNEVVYVRKAAHLKFLHLLVKSSKTQDDAENQQENVMHSDGVAEQPIQLVMVLIIHVDALPE